MTKGKTRKCLTSFALEQLEQRQFLSASPVTLLSDNFNGKSVNLNNWHMPAVQDGSTFIDDTRFRCSATDALPGVRGGVAHLTVANYDPLQSAGKPMFLGSELISNQTFSPKVGESIIFTAVVRLDPNSRSGVVAAPFMYLEGADGSNHDEIDIELLSRQVRKNRVLTNVYAAEPLGVGTPVKVKATLTDYHTYVMRWTPGKSVEWLIDGKLVRTETSKVPFGPMQVFLNCYAPGPGWADAHSDGIYPVKRKSSARQVGVWKSTVCRYR